MNKETEAQRLARLDREAGTRGRVPKTRDENISGKGWFERPATAAETVPHAADLLAALKEMLEYPAGDYSEHGNYDGARDRAHALVARAETGAPVMPPAAAAGWVKTSDRMPPDETPVLVWMEGRVVIAQRCWEYPGFEDTFDAFTYWDDPADDGQDWPDSDITHWMPLPDGPDA